MNNQWQDNLRNRMNLHEETAPDGLWEGIEEHIDNISTVDANPNRRKLVIWSLSSVAVAAVAVLLLLLLPFNSETPQQTTGFTQSITDIKQPVEPATTIEPAADKPAADNMFAENNVASTTRQSIKETADKRDNELLLTEPETSKDKSSNLSEPIVTQKEPTEPTEPQVGKTSTTKDAPTQTNNQLLAQSTQKSKQKNSKWQTNLSMSNIPSGSSESISGFGTFALQETVEDQYNVLSKYTDRSAYTDINHNLPITVALTLSYNINERWRLSSGLNYSLLTSRLKSVSANYYYDDYQTLHYIGIPVNVAYTLWRNNNLSTYINAGALVEKNVAGTLSSDYYLDNELELSTTESITTKYLQWSVNSAIGVEYKISDYLGLYAEPGISYYFGNKSELETIYKDRPFNFNLRLGLRLNINK